MKVKLKNWSISMLLFVRVKLLSSQSNQLNFRCFKQCWIRAKIWLTIFWFHQKPWGLGWAHHPRISTMEATFQSHLPDTTIFQTNSFDLLSEFALLVSYTTCSAYSSALSRESEKMSQQNKRKILFHLNKFFMIRIFFEQNHFSADCVAGLAQRDHVHKFCVTI